MNRDVCKPYYEKLYTVSKQCNKSMEFNRSKLTDFGLLVGRILGYITIAVGIIMTFLLLRTIFSGEVV